MSFILKWIWVRLRDSDAVLSQSPHALAEPNPLPLLASRQEPPVLELEPVGRTAGAVVRAFRYCCAALNAMMISSPVCKSFSLTTLLGFLDFRVCAANKAMSFRSR